MKSLFFFLPYFPLRSIFVAVCSYFLSRYTQFSASKHGSKVAGIFQESCKKYVFSRIFSNVFHFSNHRGNVDYWGDSVSSSSQFTIEVVYHILLYATAQGFWIDNIVLCNNAICRNGHRIVQWCLKNRTDWFSKRFCILPFKLWPRDLCL